MVKKSKEETDAALKEKEAILKKKDARFKARGEEMIVPWSLHNELTYVKQGGKKQISASEHPYYALQSRLESHFRQDLSCQHVVHTGDGEDDRLLCGEMWICDKHDFEVTPASIKRLARGVVSENMEKSWKAHQDKWLARYVDVTIRDLPIRLEGQWTKEYLNVHIELTRAQSTMLIQLRSGNIGLSDYLARIGVSSAPAFVLPDLSDAAGYRYSRLTLFLFY